MRLLHRAERKHEPERDAALVLRFERAADIPERPILFGEDFREAAHEDDVQRRRLTGEGFRHDGGGAGVCFHRLRQWTLLYRGLYMGLFLYTIGILYQSDAKVAAFLAGPGRLRQSRDRAR